MRIAIFGLTRLLSLVLFPVEQPQYFDAVLLDAHDRVLEVQVKSDTPGSTWIWGAIGMPRRVFHDLHALWQQRARRDEYMGTLINADLANGGEAIGLRRGAAYVDVGTLHGYRRAMRLLELVAAGAPPSRVPGDGPGEPDVRPGGALENR